MAEIKAILDSVQLANDSVGSIGAIVPTKATLVGGKDSDGFLQPLLVDSTRGLTVQPNRIEDISGLTLDWTLAALETRATSWVRVDPWKALKIAVLMETAGAVSASVQWTSAADPNVTPPGASDITFSQSQTLAGSALNEIIPATNILRFVVRVDMRWVRFVVTDVTGGQRIIVDTKGTQVPPTAPQLPIAANITDDFVAPLNQVVEKAKDPSGVFRPSRFGGVAANQGTTTTIAAGGTWTAPTRMPTAGFTGAIVIVKSDSNSASGGVKIRLFTAKTGGTELTPPLTQSYTGAPDVRYLIFPLFPGLYFTVEVTADSGSAMSSLTVLTLLTSDEVEDVSLPLSDVPQDATIASLVKAQPMMQKTGGGWANAMASAAGNPMTAIKEFLAEAPIKALTAGSPSVLVFTVDTGAAIQVDTPTVSNRKGISIKADKNNTDVVWYGYSNAITPGVTSFPLDPGESKEWDYDGTTHIYVCTGTNGQHIYVDQVSG